MDLPGNSASTAMVFFIPKMYVSRKPLKSIVVDLPSTKIQQFLNSLANQEKFVSGTPRKRACSWSGHCISETAESSEERANQAREFWVLGGLRNDIGENLHDVVNQIKNQLVISDSYTEKRLLR